MVADHDILLYQSPAGHGRGSSPSHGAELSCFSAYSLGADAAHLSLCSCWV